MCPHCHSHKIKKNGFFLSHQGRRTKVQRYACRGCRKFFSTQTNSLSYRAKKSYLDQPLFRLLNSAVSQRRAAKILGIHQTTVARKIVRLSKFAVENLNANNGSKNLEKAVFDEMETFEHTKMKPLSIAVAVEEGARRILSMQVAQMPAKGLLAERSQKKYGPREDKRPAALSTMLQTIKGAAKATLTLKSDESPRYPRQVRQVFGDAVEYRQFKGRRGCVVGQGELKAGGFDPLFSLNHTCAMTRDNVKRLSRKTWCTTKKPEMLQHMLNLYACYHNQTLDKTIRLPKIYEEARRN